MGKPTDLDLTLFRIFDEICQHDELLRDMMHAQSAIIATIKENPELHAAYARHYQALEGSDNLSSFDGHMREMQQLRERLRLIVEDPDPQNH